MKKVVVSVAIATLFWSVGCQSRNSQLSQSSSATPVPASSATVVTPKGQSIFIEVASNPETRERGLMFRDSLAADHGMLFIFPQQGVYPFWMKNTLVPLDMLWLNDQKKIVHIAEHVPPCTQDPCSNYSPGAMALYVLELKSGVASELQLKEGDTLTFRGTESYSVR